MSDVTEMLEFESEVGRDRAEEGGLRIYEAIGSLRRDQQELNRERLRTGEQTESSEAEDEDEDEEDEAEAEALSLSLSLSLRIHEEKNSEKNQKAPDQPIRYRHVPFHLGSNGHLSAS